MPPLSSRTSIEALIQRCLTGDQLAWEAHRPAVPAQGVQRRLQVRRQARRGRRSDAGHLPEDLQVARHLRSPRELPDLAHQRQPQPLHRSLPQRAQGARDDRPRRRHRASCRRPRPSAGPMAALEQRDRVELLRQALAALPKTLRTAVLMRDIQELSYQEIADRLRLPEGTVKSRINRGRTELARQIRKLRGEDYSPSGDRAAVTWSALMNVTTEQAGGVVDRPRRRAAADVSDPRRISRRRLPTLVAGRQARHPDRPDAGHLRRQRDDRLPDGSLPAGPRRRRARSSCPASRSASRRC